MAQKHSTQPFSVYRTKIKVQQAANRTIAEFIAWSLKFASAGVAPVEGFYGESFGKNTYRFHMAGKTLALGWKILILITAIFCIVFCDPQLYDFFCWWEFVSCPCTANLRACYFATKGDLKARHYMHEFDRYYRCSLSFGLNWFGKIVPISTYS